MCSSAPDPDTIIIPGVGVGVVVLGASTKMSFSSNEPVISTCEPDAKIKFDLLLFAVPFPCMKADCADDDIFYWPCMCW